MADMQQETPKPPAKPKRYLALRILKWLALALAVLILLVVLAVAALLGTESGRLWLLNTGIAMGLGEGPLQVKIEKPRSPSLGQWVFDRILVTQEGQAWIDIRNLHLRWQPSELLEKRVLVDVFAIKRLDLYTEAGPSGEEEPQPEEQESEGGGLPAIAIKSFALDRLNIVDPSRELPDYELAGDVRLFWEQRPFAINFEAGSLTETGEPGGLQVQLNSTAETSERVRLEGTVQEEAGGQLSQLVGLPDDATIDASFAATVDNTNTGYDITLDRLSIIFLDHQLAAEGLVKLGDEMQQVRLEPLRLTTDGQTHSIEGLLARDALNLRADINQLPLRLLSPWVEQIEGGQVSANLHVTGTPEDPEVAGTITGESRYSDQPVSLEVSGNFGLNLQQVEQLSLNFGEAQLQAQGQVDLRGDQTDLSFKLEDFPSGYLKLFNVALPEDFMARVSNASGRLSGELTNPSGSVTAAASGSYQQQAFDLTLDASGDKGRINLSSAQLDLPDGSARAEGVIDLNGDETDVRLNAQELPLALAELAGVELPADLSARLSGDMHAWGSLDAPTANADISAKGRYRDQPLALDLTAEGNQQRINLSRGKLTVGDASVQAQGHVDLAGQQIDMEATLSNAPLELLELADIEPPADVSATVSGTASARGALTSPEVRSQLKADGALGELPFSLVANGSYIDKRADFNQVRFELDGSSALEVDGYWHPDSFDVHITADELPSTTLSALGWDLVTGDFNADLRLAGTPDQPQIAGEFSYVGDVSGLDLATGEETTFELGWYTQVATEDQVLNLHSEFRRDQRETGTLEVAVPITRYLNHLRAENGGPLPLVFEAKGAADLAVLSLVLDPDIHRISGRAALRLEGEGNLAQPDLQGVFELLNTHYENALSGTELSDVQLLLRSRGTRITIEDGSARGSDSGRIQLAGGVDWGQLQDPDAVDIQLTANNVNLIDREDIDGEVSGEIAVTGSFEELWLRGDVEVAPLSANVDAALQNRIPEIEVTEIYGNEDLIEQQLTTEGGPTVNLDLTIRAEQQAYLRGRGLEAELAGEIHLGGTLAEPNYEGEFNIVRGVFEVFGRKFALEEGEVLFANNALYMRIPGEYEHDDYTIRAELSGTVDDIALRLSSVPSLPEDEILSLLIFGKSAESITPFQAIRLASAVQTLRGGGGGFDPISSTRDALGFDTLSVESATTESGTGVSVGVGKYINERVYLEVRRTPSEIQPWQGAVEIELSPRLHLRSSAGGEGRTRAELLWKRDF